MKIYLSRFGFIGIVDQDFQSWKDKTIIEWFTTMIRSIFFILLLAISLIPISLTQTQFVNASSKSPYDSGYDHGCDDADISYPDDRYINQPDKGPSHHTNEFMSGYNDGYDNCSEGFGQYVSSSDDNDDKGDGDSNDGRGKTYCDVPNPSNPCHDRKDYSDSTGLYTCIDGSHEEDWSDCDGGSGDNDNGDDDSNSDEETENCGGEPCTATEKEDSWVDDETEYDTGDEGLNEDGEWVDENGEEMCYEDDNGSLGARVPCYEIEEIEEETDRVE
jgi:hypothetical protein